MVDAVWAAPAGPAIEPEELSGQPRHVEHLGPTGIHPRREVDVEVALHPLSGAVPDPSFSNACATHAPP